MEYILEISHNKTLRKSFSTILNQETLEKLETVKEYLRKSNPKITKQDIVEMALNDYFEKMKIQKCQLEEVVALKIKHTGYEVRK